MLDATKVSISQLQQAESDTLLAEWKDRIPYLQAASIDCLPATSSTYIAPPWAAHRRANMQGTRCIRNAFSPEVAAAHIVTPTTPAWCAKIPSMKASFGRPRRPERSPDCYAYF